MKGWGPCRTREAMGGSCILGSRMGFICTRPHNPEPSVETKGDRDVRAGNDPQGNGHQRLTTRGSGTP